MSRTVRLFSAVFAVFASLTMIAGCGGGGGSTGAPVPGATPTPAPTAAPPTPTPPPGRSSTTSVVVGAGGTTLVFPPVTGGIRATLGLPPATSGAGTTINGVFSVDPPAGVPAPQSGGRSTRASLRPKGTGRAAGVTTHTPLVYASVSDASAVTLNGTLSLTVTLPSIVSGQYYVAFYDGTGWQYEILGPSTAANGVVTSTGSTLGPIGVAPNAQYVFALTTDSVATPAPTPTVTPSPTPAPTAFPLTNLSRGIYVADPNNQIVEYAPGITGTANVYATIAGPATQLDVPTGVAFDSANDNIYVSNQSSGPTGGSVTVYNAGASGNATPLGTIQGDSSFHPASIALDASNAVYAGSNVSRTTSGFKFAAGAFGAQQPVATYQSTCDGCRYPAIVIAPNGTVAIGAAGFTYFDRSANGNNVAPAASFMSAAMPAPMGAAYDTAGNFVASTLGTPGTPAAVLTFAGTPVGSNVTPIASLSGANTQIVTPGAIAFDEQGYLYVLNTSMNAQGGTACSILAFAPNATGNAAPVATIPSVCGSGIATVRTVVQHGPVSRRRGF